MFISRALRIPPRNHPPPRQLLQSALHTSPPLLSHPQISPLHPHRPSQIVLRPSPASPNKPQHPAFHPRALCRTNSSGPTFAICPFPGQPRRSPHHPHWIPTQRLPSPRLSRAGLRLYSYVTQPQRSALHLHGPPRTGNLLSESVPYQRHRSEPHPRWPSPISPSRTTRILTTSSVQQRFTNRPPGIGLHRSSRP